MSKLKLLYLLTGFMMFSCNNAVPLSEKTNTPEVRTPVTVTSINESPLADYIELNATSAFLQKSIVKANANGYIQIVNTQIGKYVNAGQELFSIKTKESQSIGNAINILDSTLHFSGLNNIRASTMGYITELNHQSGDYVQDGEQLAVISNQNSFVFLLNLPYELRPYLALNKTLELVLPDKQELHGMASSTMPSVDSASQTQSVVIRVSSKTPIPENLVAKVRFVRSLKNNSMSLPKAAILTDEAQTYAWVMKMIDTITAVRVDIKKGITTDDRVEVLSPKFLAADKILLTGNYGLPDTAKVTIIKDTP
jgi:multidrug efflux pump subunit AcrA (membrane-fusion protein)